MPPAGCLFSSPVCDLLTCSSWSWRVGALFKLLLCTPHFMISWSIDSLIHHVYVCFLLESGILDWVKFWTIYTLPVLMNLFQGHLWPVKLCCIVIYNIEILEYIMQHLVWFELHMFNRKQFAHHHLYKVLHISLTWKIKVKSLYQMSIYYYINFNLSSYIFTYITNVMIPTDS